MIKVIHDFNVIPLKLKSQTALNQKDKAVVIVLDARRMNNKPKNYREKYTKYKEVIDELKLIYKNKCAYCETKHIEHAAPFQVEHYRPVGGLDIPSDALYEYHKMGDCYHNGYYWLGNEWSNLLISCPNCNGKAAKSAKFWIRERRIFDEIHSSLIEDLNLKEEPLLLHPALFGSDKPENHLSFINQVDILGKMISLSEQGKATIQICDLNRDNLIKRRYWYIKKWFKDIKRAIINFENNDYKERAFRICLSQIFNDIEEQADDSEEFSLWARFVLDNFPLFVQKEISAIEYQKEIIEAFRLHKKGELASINIVNSIFKSIKRFTKYLLSILSNLILRLKIRK